MPQPIDLYYWPTPNGWKVSIFLEETGLDYNLIPVDIGAGDQYDPGYLKLNPNNKMPTIVDPEGPGGEPISVFESGAILIYLSEKTGQFFPELPRERYNALEWLMFQMGSVGPMLGQAHHFRQYAPEEISYAIDRYTNEAARIYGVVDRRLADRDYFIGDYSIVDMAVYPWLVPYENQGQKLEDYPNLARWFESVSDRPAVQRGLAVGEELRRPLQELDEEARNKLFGIDNK
ncbi:MAG: glutathione S-transferase N-terminal domain-containing protein [Rubrobacteraceae bacterium]